MRSERKRWWRSSIRNLISGGETVVQQVENITNADITVRMALDLARTNADSSLVFA